MTRNWLLVLPFATWMVLMTALPSTASAYAVRTCATALTLLAVLRACQRHELSAFRRCEGSIFRSVLIGVIVGIGVFALWILPEQFDWPWYGRFCIMGEGGTTKVETASRALLTVRLVGSAFVISIAEELFFRKWLIPFAGFWGSVALFAVEHDRYVVGAMAGVIYGLAYLRKGLLAAIVAHATTNLILGLWVLKTGQWQFW